MEIGRFQPGRRRQMAPDFAKEGGADLRALLWCDFGEAFQFGQGAFPAQTDAGIGERAEFVAQPFAQGQRPVQRGGVGPKRGRKLDAADFLDQGGRQEQGGGADRPAGEGRARDQDRAARAEVGRGGRPFAAHLPPVDQDEKAIRKSLLQRGDASARRPSKARFRTIGHMKDDILAVRDRLGRKGDDLGVDFIGRERQAKAIAQAERFISGQGGFGTFGRRGRDMGQGPADDSAGKRFESGFGFYRGSRENRGAVRVRHQGCKATPDFVEPLRKGKRRLGAQDKVLRLARSLESARRDAGGLAGRQPDLACGAAWGVAKAASPFVRTEKQIVKKAVGRSVPRRRDARPGGRECSRGKGLDHEIGPGDGRALGTFLLTPQASRNG